MRDKIVRNRTHEKNRTEIVRLIFRVIFQTGNERVIHA